MSAPGASGAAGGTGRDSAAGDPVASLRPASVPAELAVAWDLLERRAVRAVVVEADGGALWAARPEAERHRALAAELAAQGALHVAFSPEAFAALRERAGERAPAGARLADVWADVPEWCHPGTARADLVARELTLILEGTVPDPDVAALLTAAAADRLPTTAFSHGLLSADQTRHRLEHRALDAVTWRDVVVRGADEDDDLVSRAVPCSAEDDRPVLVLAARPVPEAPGRHVVLLGGGSGTADLAVQRTAERLREGPELAAVPAPLRAAWLEGATILGPVLAGFAEWSVRHASGHPGGAVLCLAEPDALLPLLLAETAGARGLALRVDPVPLTPELLVASLADDPLRAALRASADAAPDGPVVLCQVGGSGAVQERLSRLLRRDGSPRHVVGLHLLSDRAAADAALGDAGGEVHGYLANLGLPEPAHARAARWRHRLEVVAGAPDRSRVALDVVAPGPDDLEALRTEAARRGVLAFLRAHLRTQDVAGPGADLLQAGRWLADRLPELPPAPAPSPADALIAPPAVVATLDRLERDLDHARAELAHRDAVVSTRTFRLVVQLRTLVARIRAR